MFCTTTTWNVQKRPSYMFYEGHVVCVRFFPVHLFFHCRLFSPWWSLAFLIFSPPLKNFHVFLPKNGLLCFWSLALALYLLKFGCFEAREREPWESGCETKFSYPWCYVARARELRYHEKYLSIMVMCKKGFVYRFFLSNSYWSRQPRWY